MIEEKEMGRHDLGADRFEYLDRNESIYLLSLLKHSECIHCPDFYLNCGGNYSHAELVNMNPKKYISQQKLGTEPFLCGKLRTIANIDAAKLNELNVAFDKTIKEKVGFIDFDLNEKFVLGSTTFSIQMANMERQYALQLDTFVAQANKKIEELHKLVHVKDQQITEIKRMYGQEKRD